MSTVFRTALLGTALGALVAAPWLLLVERARRYDPGCAEGWTHTQGDPLPGAVPIVSCTREGRTGGPPARVTLYRTGEPAAPMVASALRAVAARIAPGVALPATLDRVSAEEARIETVTATLDVREVELNADVYFVSGGRRFGLLTIVHTEGAPFARPERTAEWLSTIEGTAPWGAPDRGMFRARCPEGFTAQPTQGERAIVRCIHGVGTASFTALTFNWDEGGFGSEEDRTRAAGALANRVAASQGAAARVLSAPTPFTLAANVDAIHTRIATGEKVPITVRITAAHAPRGEDDALGIATGDLLTPTAESLGEMFRRADFIKPSNVLARRRVALPGAIALVVLATVLGALVGRKRSKSTA